MFYDYYCEQQWFVSFLVKFKYLFCEFSHKLIHKLPQTYQDVKYTPRLPKLVYKLN